MGRLIDAPISVPAPQARLQFADGGLEYVVRYPVDLHRATQIDEQVTREVMEVISGTPEVKEAVTGTPRIRSAIRS